MVQAVQKVVAGILPRCLVYKKPCVDRSRWFDIYSWCIVHLVQASCGYLVANFIAIAKTQACLLVVYQDAHA